MEIKYGKYTVRSDSMNLWVEEEYTDRKGKPAARRVTGYARTFPELYQSFIGKKIRGSEAKTFEELRAEIAEISGEVMKIIEEVKRYE